MKIKKIPLIVLGVTTVFSSYQCKIIEEDKPMNVLLIISDDLNDWTSIAKGHPQVRTPNIERLANKAVVFTNAQCASPVCGPSRAALLTGYYPPTTGVLGNRQYFRETPGLENVVTLPQYFAKYGYYTAASGKILHHSRGTEELPAKLSDDISWHEQYIGEIGVQIPDSLPEYTLVLPPSTDRFRENFIWGASHVKTEDTYDYLLAKYVADKLHQPHDKPFFLACGIYRPHLPWVVPQEFFDMYDPEDIALPEVYENDLDDIPEIPYKWIRHSVHKALVEQGLWKDAVRAYLASISYADYCIGVLLDALESSDYNDNTVIILIGDHGWHLGEKNHWSKFALWERATRTSFMMHVPGIKAGRSDAPVNLVDIYPSLLDVCNLPPKDDLEGRSIKPLLNKPDTIWPYPTITWFGNEKNYAIKDYSWRYIHYSDGTEELYDHTKDPHEWHNIASDPEHKSKIEELRQNSGLGSNNQLIRSN